MYKQGVNIDLHQTTKIKGQISSAGVAYRTAGRAHRIPVFAFTLDDLSQRLGVYQPSRNYTTLSNQLTIGDTVIVYYRPRLNDAIDIDVYQIEKNGHVVVDYASYSHNHAMASFWIAALGLLLLLYGIYQLFKKPSVLKIK